MRLRYLILWFVVLPMTAQTRLFTFGVEGGMPTKTPLGRTDSRMPFVIGLTVNFRVSARFSLETGVLFHRMGQVANTLVFPYPETAVTTVSSTERGRAFELPFLARYRFLSEHRAWRPFVTAGPSVRRTSLDASQFVSVLGGAQPGGFAPQLFSRKTVKWTADPTVGAGVDFKTGRFHLEPQVRYSYWGAARNTSVRKNQVNLLLGFRF